MKRRPFHLCLSLAVAAWLCLLGLLALRPSIAQAADNPALPETSAPRPFLNGLSAFTLTAHIPLANAIGVDVSQNITASFDAELNAATVTSHTFTVRSSLRGLFTDTATVNGSGLTLGPSGDFFTGEQVQVVGSAAISSTGGAALTPAQWGFTAGPLTDRCFLRFSDSGTADDALAAVDRSSVAWGDYDNDGDLDILLAGRDSGSSLVARLYRNDGGVFADSGTADDALTGVFAGSLAWGDYDNDGDLDILLTGQDSGSNPVVRLYRNDDGLFADSGTADDALTGVALSSVAWGDYDNDGDLDILLTGRDSGNVPVARLYRNDGGLFADSGTADDALTGVRFSSVAWGDYDNDGDLDILLTGQDSGLNPVAKVYRNDGGLFTDSGTADDALTAVSGGSVAWGDYDNDSDLDILLTGQGSGNVQVAHLYRNDGGLFADSGTADDALTPVDFSSVAWGDYDNDGDLDILLTGQDSGNNPVAEVYRNDGGLFADSGTADDALTAVDFSSVAWGDYDNDGDLDILLTGADSGDNSVARLYGNDDCPDLALAKAVTPANAAPGAAITYTLSFSNSGSGVATGVVVSDSVPLSVTVSGVVSSTVGAGVVISQTSASPNFAWAVSDLAAGAGGVITLTGTLSNSAALYGTQFANTATITATNDGTATNNSASASLSLSIAPFHLTSHIPFTNAIGVAVSQNITASFDAELDAATPSLCAAACVGFSPTPPQSTAAA